MSHRRATIVTAIIVVVLFGVALRLMQLQVVSDFVATGMLFGILTVAPALRRWLKTRRFVDPDAGKADTNSRRLSNQEIANIYTVLFAIIIGAIPGLALERGIISVPVFILLIIGDIALMPFIHRRLKAMEW